MTMLYAIKVNGRWTLVPVPPVYAPRTWLIVWKES